MKNSIFYLSTCSTCTRIIKELDVDNSFHMQDIKFDKITENQVDELAGLAGSYEALFSRRVMKFRAMGLHEKTLSEKDCRQFILDEYTFLKRPVIVIEGEIFIGNSKATIAAAREKMHR